jgi:hypothetical protein
MIVNSALYGQVNAGHLWQQCLWQYLSEHGWKQCADKCTWIRHASRICIWTDDIIFRGPAEQQAQFIDECNTRFPGCTVTDGSTILGHRVTQNPDGHTTIDSTRYINDTLQRFNITAKCNTPLPAGTAPHRSSDPSQDPHRTTQYQQIVGAISYIASTTRPDISFAASALGQTSKEPSVTNLKHATRTLGYLNRTRHYAPSYNNHAGNNTITTYVDASYADSIQHRSQTGYLIEINGGPVSWKSKCQTYVSLSTQEAEVVAACDAIKEIQYLRCVLQSWHTPKYWHTAQTGPTVLYEDNEAAISFFEAGIITSRNKHFATKLEHIRRLIYEDHIAEAVHISSDEQRADILTKALANAKQSQHTDKMLKVQYLNIVARIYNIDTHDATSTAGTL